MPSHHPFHWCVKHPILVDSPDDAPEQARQFLGPDIEIHSMRYACTESQIGLSYNPLESNQFKLTSEAIIEFLDINKSDSISSLVQPVGTPVRLGSFLTSFVVGG